MRRARLAIAAALVAGALAGPARAEPASNLAAWEIELPARVELLRGAVAQVPLVLRAKGRYRVAPSGVRVALAVSSPGLSLRQRRYQRGDAQDADSSAEAMTFSLAVRGEASGEHALEVRASFWVCTARVCLPADEARTVAVVVTEPPPPPSPPAAEPQPAPAPPPPSSGTRRPLRKKP